MKKFITVLIFLFLLNSICLSQSGWYASQTNMVFRGLHKNGSMLNIACEGGAILRTTNNGVTWYYVRNYDLAYPYNDFYCVYFFNQTTGIAAGLSSVLKTTNSGDNWFQVYSTGRVVRGIDFINTNTGFAVGGSQYPYNILLKTTNQGSSWVSVVQSTSLSFTDIKFLNSTTGFVTGDSGLVMKSTDSGDNWIMRKLGTTKQLRTVFFIDTNTGWVGGDSGRMFLTTNCGTDWSSKLTPIDYRINDIFFSSYNIGVCALDSGKILFTSNGGQNWISIITNGNYNLYSVIKTDNDNWFTFGGKSQGTSTIVRQYGVFKSSDNGLNWDEIISGNNYAKWSVYFLDTLTGFVGGNEGTLMKTMDGGITWKLLAVQTSTHIYDIQFINQNTGWFTSYPQWFSRTTNGGINWTIISSSIGRFHFFDSSNGIGIGGGYVNKTTNSGLNWTAITSVSAGGLFFVNNKYGWAYGGGEVPPYNSAILYRTSDGGDSWNLTPVPFYYGIRGLFFIDSLNGWLCLNYPPENQDIFKSTNGGLNWSVVGNSHGISIYFLNSSIGFLLRENSSIFKTFDSGNNWYSVFNLSGVYWWHDIQFVNSNLGFAVSENSITGHVVYTTNAGGEPLQIKTENIYLPTSFSLSQNYPNPFNPVTRIKYDVPANVKSQTANVKLIIYDVLGREIETLVNQTQKPGSYEVQWDGSRYASGVYFYKLITDDWTKTKKMVLIK